MKNEITFGELAPIGHHRSLGWQPVYVDGKYVAELGQYVENILSPPIQFYQVLADDTEWNRSICNSWHESEDEGKIYLRFDFQNEKKFLEYVNSVGS